MTASAVDVCSAEKSDHLDEAIYEAFNTMENQERPTQMILDSGCTRAMCSRHACNRMIAGLKKAGSPIQAELLEDASTFCFANSQRSVAKEKCRIWISTNPPLFTDFSIIEEGHVPFLMSLPQMKNLGFILDMSQNPVRVTFNKGFLKGQGMAIDESSSRHLVLDVAALQKDGQRGETQRTCFEQFRRNRNRDFSDNRATNHCYGVETFDWAVSPPRKGESRGLAKAK